MNFASRFLSEVVTRQGLNYITKNPEKNLINLLEWAEKIAIFNEHKEIIKNLKKEFDDPNSNIYKFTMKLIKETNQEAREKLAINFFLHACLLGIPTQRDLTEKLKINIPWSILIDPTERCNLRCTGCWAGAYERNTDLDLEIIDRVITEAEKLGIYFFVVSGGEPFIRKEDLFALARKHKDAYFEVYTNGTFINEQTIKELVELGNISPTISLEGFEATTDARRGKGVYQKIMHAMELLKEAGIVFGFSVTYTRQNTEEVGSEEFIDLLIEKGCKYGWLYTYIPVGVDADLNLMATPQQRAYMVQRLKYFRQTKPIFLADFWNDGDKVDGCIAGGRRYFHINARGDIEPCAFIHYATDNIKNLTLLEALDSPLMRAYQKRQPFNPNMLRPCPLIDNPQALREIVEEAQAHPTQVDAQGGVQVLTENLEDYAQQWGQIADDLWQKSQAGK